MSSNMFLLPVAHSICSSDFFWSIKNDAIRERHLLYKKSCVFYKMKPDGSYCHQFPLATGQEAALPDPQGVDIEERKNSSRLVLEI